MSVVVITPPELLVDLNTARAHLRVDDDSDDTLIEAYISAACGHIDGPNGWLGRSIGVQTLEARLSRFDCDLVTLPYGPLISLVSIIYDDTDGAEQTLDPSAYSLASDGALRAFSTSWPSARYYRNSIRVRYMAGYVADPEADPLVAAVPPAITAAVLLMVGDLYSRRETTADGSVSAVPMSTTVDALLAPYRVWRV